VFKLFNNSLAFDGGHSDELSCQTGKILLGLPEKYQSIEIIYATGSVFTHHCIFVLVGAHYQNITLNGKGIKQNKVYEANKNDVLKFGRIMYGFRLYLMACPFVQNRIGKCRDEFEGYFSPVTEKIRLIKGPEFDYLKKPEEFLDRPFVISANSDLSGIRLEGTKIMAKRYDIISLPGKRNRPVVHKGVQLIMFRSPV